MFTKFLWITIVLCAVNASLSCQEQINARKIVDACIAAHGGGAFQHSFIEFEFRGKHYSSERRNGHFKYKRVYRDSTRWIVDILDNHGFTRTINSETVALDDKTRNSLSNSLNSVMYFALLPFPLNDPAVKKQYLGGTIIHGQPYYQIKVTFQAEGGGDDFDDAFLYWIHKKKHTLDYFAYRYHVNGGGVRFREAVNPRVINGIRMTDYLNYKPTDETTALTLLDAQFEAGNLIKVSEIRLEALQINLLERPQK